MTGRRRSEQKVLPDPSLRRNIAFTVATQGAVIAVALVTTPVILSGLGLAAFGVWTVALAVASYIMTLGSGFGASLQRFTAVAAGEDEPDATTRLFWTGVAFFSGVGLLIAVLSQSLSPALVSAFDVTGPLKTDAISMWRLMGVSIAVALVASFLGNVQHALGRFRRFAADQSAALLLYGTGLVIAVEAGGGLPALAAASLGYHVLLVVFRAVSLRDIAVNGRLGLADRRLRRELGRFSAFVQLTMMGNLVNLQSDRVIAGLVATPGVVGQLGIGSQVATALRMVGGSAISPVLTRLSMTQGTNQTDQILADFRQINRAWWLTLLGVSVVLGVALVPLMDTWVGSGHEQAAFFGTILIFAYTVNLLSAPGASLLAAQGRPDIETKYTVLTAVLNIAGSVAFGLLLGVTGIVAATAGAYVIGTAWFFLKLRRFVRWLPHDPVPLAMRVMSRLAPVSAVAYAWCWLIQALVPSGYGVVPAGIGLAACVFVYLRLLDLVPEASLILRGSMTAR
jgi:O-antigen/teichoic acid export membrane protein